VADDQEFLLDQLIAYLPLGRAHATPASELAENLGVSTRTIGELVERAITERGYAIGSMCGAHHGYFLIMDAEDARVGVAHTVARGRAIFARIRALQKNTEAVLQEPQPTLFEMNA
jgi:hypothetical protein